MICMTKTDEKGKEYEHPKIYGICQSGGIW